MGDKCEEDGTPEITAVLERYDGLFHQRAGYKPLLFVQLEEIEMRKRSREEESSEQKEGTCRTGCSGTRIQFDRATARRVTA